jgi:hypothetical protein
MYDKPIRETFCFNAVDLHTADITKYIRGPAGLRGRLVDVLAAVTTTLAGATTKPILKVGISGTLGESLNWNLGAQAAGAAPLRASAQAGTTALQKNANTGVMPIIAADTDVILTMAAATGSGAAGVGDLAFTFEWF